MWKPQDTGWGRRSWIVKKIEARPSGGLVAHIDGFAHRAGDWRNRKFASQEAAQKRCDELNNGQH